MPRKQQEMDNRDKRITQCWQGTEAFDDDSHKEIIQGMRKTLNRPIIGFRPNLERFNLAYDRN